MLTMHKTLVINSLTCVQNILQPYFVGSLTSWALGICLQSLCHNPALLSDHVVSILTMTIATATRTTPAADKGCGKGKGSSEAGDQIILQKTMYSERKQNNINFCQLSEGFV